MLTIWDDMLFLNIFIVVETFYTLLLSEPAPKSIDFEGTNSELMEVNSN